MRCIAVSVYLLASATGWAASGQLVVTSSPAGAEIRIDGTDAGTAPVAAREVLVGEHLVEARWPDGRTASGVARVSEGASTVTLLEAPPPAGTTPSPPPEPAPAPAPPLVAPPPPVPATVVVVSAAPRKPIYKKWWFWTAIGGAAAVIIAVGAGVGAAYATPPGYSVVEF